MPPPPAPQFRDDWLGWHFARQGPEAEGENTGTSETATETPAETNAETPSGTPTPVATASSNTGIVANTASGSASASVPAVSSASASASANSTSNSNPQAQALSAAESRLASCVTFCIAGTDKRGCGQQDIGCQCANIPFQAAVLSCWKVSCTQDEYLAGLSYSSLLCQLYGINPGGTGNGTSSPVALNTTLAPMVISRAAWNIQAVMSSICSLLLVVALVLGILNCRNQIRREQIANQQWTHVVSTDKRGPILPRGQGVSYGSQRGETFSQFMRAGTGPLDSIVEDGDGAFTPTQMQSFHSAGPSVNRPYRGMHRGSGVFGANKFTNRLSPDEVEGLNGGGAFEMKSVGGASSSAMSDGSAEEAEVGVAVAGHGGAEGEVEDAMVDKGKGKEVADKEKEDDKDTEDDVDKLAVVPALPTNTAADRLSVSVSEPHTPTSMSSEYGSSTNLNLRKVAGE